MAIAFPGIPVAAATVAVIDFVLPGKGWMPKRGLMPACME